jgi:hypothetical protein
MLFRLRSTLRLCAFTGIAVLALAGCGRRLTTTADGASSPWGAVATFLAPFPHTPLVGLSASEQRPRALALWRTMCDRVDPAIRRGLRVTGDVTIPDAHMACGAVVVLMAVNVPDGSGISPPAAMTGTPRGAATHGNTSIVTVDVRYQPMPNPTAPPPPARATIKVLVVKRDGRWWVATPDAFNPAHAGDGGLTEPELRRSYATLLAAAR